MIVPVIMITTALTIIITMIIVIVTVAPALHTLLDLVTVAAISTAAHAAP